MRATMRTLTDQELFEKIRNRDQRALAELIRRYTSQLFPFINRMVQDKQCAEDILQDTFVRIWEKSHQYRGEAAVKTWIFRIALNRTYTYLERRKRFRWVGLDKLVHRHSPEPVNGEDVQDERDWLKRALIRLTPRQRAVVVGRIYQELPYTEIAAALGCSVNSAKVHFHEAKKRLRQWWQQEGQSHG